MQTPLGEQLVVFICNNCGNHWERDDLTFNDYAEMDEIVYEDDVGCPLCRQKRDGYTPYITYK